MNRVCSCGVVLFRDEVRCPVCVARLVAASKAREVIARERSASVG